MSQSIIPDAVYTIWWIALLVTLVVFVPLSVYLLHRTFVAARSIRRYADEVVCLRQPPRFRAVGLHYDDFTPTTDADVLACLNRAEARLSGAVAGR